MENRYLLIIVITVFFFNEDFGVCSIGFKRGILTLNKSEPSGHLATGLPTLS